MVVFTSSHRRCGQYLGLGVWVAEAGLLEQIRKALVIEGLLPDAAAVERIVFVPHCHLEALAGAHMLARQDRARAGLNSLVVIWPRLLV